MGSFDQKTVLVTGAASGIGRSVARMVGEQGGKAMLADVSDAGEAVAEETGGMFYRLDVADEAAWQELAKEIGTPDYIHLNAGIMVQPPGKPLAESNVLTVPLENYRRLMAVNVDGVLLGIRTFVPEMMGGNGAICVTASVAGLTGLNIDPAYAMTKHAVVGLVRSLCLAWQQESLRINAICPGGVDTGIVPDDFPRDGFMHPDVMAAEAIDLLLDGGQGEVRVKRAQDEPAIVIQEPSLAPS